LSIDANFPGAVGNVITLYTVSRAVRGALVGQTPEWLMIESPTIVWSADKHDTNHKASNYFVTGRVPKGDQEEDSGARLVLVAKGAAVHGCDHKVRGKTKGAKLPDLGPGGYPVVGAFVFACTVTHEMMGRVAFLGNEGFTVKDAAMINEINTGSFADVLHERAEGEDHYSVDPMFMYWHSLSMVFIR